MNQGQTTKTPTSVAIMQPYVFPYLGYFNLIHASDRFVLLDDVSFIKKGWINRNRILASGRDEIFTIPLVGASQNKAICDTHIDMGSNWKKTLHKKVELAYRRARNFQSGFELFEHTIGQDYETIAELALISIKAVNRYLGISTQIIESSRSYENSSLTGQDRIIDIVRREGGTRYINPPGGMALYDSERFNAKGIELRFIRPELPAYSQFAPNFIPGLSIIDVIMNNDIDKIQDMLRSYAIIPPD